VLIEMLTKKLEIITMSHKKFSILQLQDIFGISKKIQCIKPTDAEY
jgi:hypothetical protein